MTLQKISHAIFELEDHHGHLKWKVTDLVRKLKMSRSLIYDYLGSSKKEILISAFKNFIDEFYGFDHSNGVPDFAEQIKQARQRMLNFPSAILFYQKWRSQDSWLKQEFIIIENKFQLKLSKRFPEMSKLQILSLHSLIHGLVTAPFLTGDEAASIFRYYWISLNKT